MKILKHILAWYVNSWDNQRIRDGLNQFFDQLPVFFYLQSGNGCLKGNKGSYGPTYHTLYINKTCHCSCILADLHRATGLHEILKHEYIP